MITLTKAQRENALATLKPMAIAQLLYQHTGRDAAKFAEDLWDYLTNAFVFSTPSLFAMGRAVELDDGRHAWFVNMLVGSLDELLQYIPFPLPWIAFQRRGEDRVRVYDFARLTELARVKGQRPHAVNKKEE